MEKISVFIELPKVALEWLQRLAIVEGDFKDYLVHVLLDHLRIWIDCDDDRGEVLSELAVISMHQEGIFDIFSKYKVESGLSNDCYEKLLERLETSQVAVSTNTTE